jgi:hypothetical protein
MENDISVTKKCLLAYFGHHKCATTWINDINLQICMKIGLKFANVNNPKMFNHDLKSFVSKNKIKFLGYSNAEYKHVKEIIKIKGFHVIRDPRDIAVSAYFSHLNSHPITHWPELLAHRKKLKKVSKGEGLFLDMEFTKNVYEDLFSWNYSQTNVLEIKMEELIQNPYEILVKAYNFLGLIDDTGSVLIKHMVFHCFNIINRINRKTGGIFPFRKKIPLEELLYIIYNNRFSKKAEKRNPGEEDSKSHYRKGLAGDWVNHFNPDHKKYFKEKYNDLLINLGYEKNADW